MATDNEIDFNIKMPTGTSDEFRKLLDQFRNLSAGIKESLAAVGAEVKDVAEAARIMRERAQSTGSQAIVKAVEGSFTEGWSGAATLDAKHAKISAGVGTLDNRVGSVTEALAADKITIEQATAAMAKYVAAAQKALTATGELNYTFEASKGDLFSAERLDEVLASFNRMDMTMRDTKSAAAGLASELRAQADALAEERESLDGNSASYEQAAAKLMQQEAAYRKLASSAGAVTAETDKAVAKVKAVIDAYDGSDEAMQKVIASVEAAVAASGKLDEKLSKVAADRDMSEQKKAASAEKEAEKAQQAAEKEAEAARLREEREAELAARREAREAAQAAREQERDERARYAMELSTQSKQQLIQTLDRLRKAREAAAAAGDEEGYKRLTRQFMQAREQMERTNVALNVQRMMYMQQAQAVQRMSETFEKLSTQVDNVGESAEEGELDLVGMAEGATEMFSQFQAGLGPMGWFMLALQQLQGILNDTAKSQQRVIELTRQQAETHVEADNAYKAVREARQAAIKEAEKEARMTSLADQYREANKQLAENIRLIGEATNAELARLGITQEQNQFERTLKKMELGRKLREGLISRREYEEALIKIDEEASNEAAWGKFKVARAKRGDAEVKAHAYGLEVESAEEKRTALQGDFDQRFKYSNREVEAMVKHRDELKAKSEAAEEELKKQLKGLDIDLVSLEAVGIGVKQIISTGLKNPAALGGLLGQYTKTPLEQFKDELHAAVAAASAAQNEYAAYTSFVNEQTGGGAIKYMDARDEAAAELELAKRAEEEAKRLYEEAKRAAEEAKKAEKEARDSAERNEKNQARLRQSREEDLNSEERLAMAKQVEAERRSAASKMTSGALRKRIAKLKKESSEIDPSSAAGSDFAAQIAILTEEKNARDAVVKTARKAQKYDAELGTGTAGGKALDNALGMVSNLADGIATEQQFNQLIQALTVAQQTRTRADDDLVRALILQVKKIKDGDKETMRKVKQVQYELTR